MMYWGKERGRSFWVKRAIFIPIAIVAGVFVFGNVVMFLWNEVLATVTGVSIITFWQALGILVLSKILFGGLGGGRCHGKYHGRGHKWSEKWANMSPEEKEKMKAEWKSWCKPTEEKE